MTDDYIIAQQRLADIRLRIINNVPVSAAEMRANLMDLRRGRESAAAASASAKRRERASGRKVLADTGPLDLTDLFGASQG